MKQSITKPGTRIMCYEINEEELIRYIKDQLPDIDLETIAKILDKEFEFLKAKGVIK
jgi:hypothetical protein